MVGPAQENQSPSYIQRDYNEDEYFGNVRLQDSDVLETTEDVIISMRNVHKTYLLGVEGVPALRGVSLTIKRGEFVCIFGTSGGGKTTMLNIIGTIDKPTKGEMYLCGTWINQNTKDQALSLLRLKNIGFVFQTFNLLSSLTALENVEMPMILLGELSASERRERAISLLTMVGMKDRLDHVPSQLSGGEQQRVTIARAMANKPDILLLDEPTGDLDTANTALIMKILNDLNKIEGITLVMVTHDVGLKMFSDRVVWMRDGKVQRIECISEMARNDNLSKLNSELEIIEQKRMAKKADKEEQAQNGGVGGSDKGKSSNNNNNKDNPKSTIIRTPLDYRPVAWAHKLGNNGVTPRSPDNSKKILVNDHDHSSLGIIHPNSVNNNHDSNSDVKSDINSDIIKSAIGHNPLNYGSDTEPTLVRSNSNSDGNSNNKKVLPMPATPTLVSITDNIINNSNNGDYDNSNNGYYDNGNVNGKSELSPDVVS